MWRSTSPNRPGGKNKSSTNGKCFVFVTAPTKKKAGYDEQLIELNAIDERRKECQARLLASLAEERVEAALALRAQGDDRAVPAAPAEM